MQSKTARNVPKANKMDKPNEPGSSGSGVGVQVGSSSSIPFFRRLAEVFYYDSHVGKDKVVTPFEKLSLEDQRPWIEKSLEALKAIDKLGWKFGSNVQSETGGSRQKNIDVLERIIRAFLPNIKHPKGVERFFPVKELALWIYDVRVE
jgi:hypothetical protein